MSFTTLHFVGFLTVVVVGFVLVPVRQRWLWLLASSLVFYAYSGPIYLLQIVFASTFAFTVAFAIEKEPEKKPKQLWLTLAVVGLLANLSLFKYAGALNGAIGAVTGWPGVADGPIPLIMPLGISFYSFQLIGYLVDVYRGQPAERHLGIFTVFTTFFPKVISGPIERSKNLLPQLHAMPAFSFALAMAGAQLMVWGAFKKIVVADRIAPFVDRVYSAPHEFEGVAIAFATWLYAFQLYFDFSGYTDMALGAAMIMGFKLIPNFDRPYFAATIQDFWKRWHISLTSWLTDYVYTPITRAKWIKIKLYNLILVALMVTFIVSGAWHGSHWTFLLWGALHGSYIVASLLLQKPWNNFARWSGITRYPRTYTAFKIARTFSLVCFAYILFRATSLNDAIFMMTNLHTGWDDIAGNLELAFGWDLSALMLGLVGIFIAMTPEFYKLDGPVTLPDIEIWRQAMPTLGLMLAIVFFGAFDGLGQQFIYFRF